MSTDRVNPAEPRPELLGSYLNDHLAGSAGGLALARRLARSHRNTTASGHLDALARQIESDRTALIELMSALGVSRARHMEGLAILGERLARFKPNGHLWQRSPLSSVIELEMLSMGVLGKRAGWRTLRTLADSDPRLDKNQLDELISRADGQAGVLEELRIAAVNQALRR